MSRMANTEQLIRSDELLREPRSMFRALNRSEFELREEFVRADFGPLGSGPSPSSPLPTPQGLLEMSARTLEFHLVLASLVETCHELGVATVADLARESARVSEMTSRLARLNIDRVLLENARALGIPPEVRPLPPDASVAVPLAKTIPTIRSVLEVCPIENLEELARTVEGLAGLGHRCRTAYDALRAFVRRTTEPDARARSVVKPYIEGRLSLQEVANILGCDRSDAAAFLEEVGYCRSLETIEIPDAERVT